MSIIFDFNGTIIFDKPIVEESWQQFFITILASDIQLNR